MRSVDMQIWPWFANAPNTVGVDRLVEIGVVQHDQRRLAAELEQHRLQVLRRALRDDLADARRAGEVDAPHRRVRDQRLGDLAPHPSASLRDDVDDAIRHARIAQRVADQPMRAPGRLPTP